jgi:hypothetical protein
LGADGAGRGVVGDADPVLAVERLWDRDRFDQVTVSTLPTHLSRWLGIGLRRRRRAHHRAPSPARDRERAAAAVET